MDIKVNIKKQDLINFIRAIVYFVYPKVKDFYKPILIVIGFFYGVLVNKIGFENIEWRNLFLMLFMFDFLIYQARFQLNDIFELRDKKNIDPKKIFFNIGLTREKTIFISSIVIALRLILFLSVIFFVGKNIALNILLCIGLIIFFAVCYEIARAKKSIFPVFFFVCFGYPLRFFAGFLAAFENNFLNINFSFDLILVLIAYAFFGEFANILYWTKEALAQKEKNIELRKKHYEFLCNKAKGKLFLDGKGKIFDIWNWNFILSIFFLSLAILLKSDFDILIFFLEICFWVFIIFFVLASKKKLSLITPFLFFIWSLKICLFDWEVTFFCLNQAMFICVYYFLRFLSGFGKNNFIMGKNRARKFSRN